MVKKKFEKQKWIHKANLHWIVNGDIRETILFEQPYPTCRKKKKELEKINHYKYGKLVVVSCRVKDTQKAIDKELAK
jgi:hypothetical protein